MRTIFVNTVVGLDDREFDSTQGQENFLSLQLFIDSGTIDRCGCFFQSKVVWREVDCFRPSNSNIKNEWNLPPFTVYYFIACTEITLTLLLACGH